MLKFFNREIKLKLQYGIALYLSVSETKKNENANYFQ